ncbi:hypothetical protein GGQ88_004031 [Novosphingobium hassiacum]|uniref:Uncharacterized protein n=1 Tax=Novosphingobium hassiacum TaxID=173676 RepID=A0A7W6EYD3_9SPHN|nr:hypothetical protein [Novosphingobium hassiacum]MBB3862729.1 hypothetical protein [Novosphingobium hassiacum]
MIVLLVTIDNIIQPRATQSGSTIRHLDDTEKPIVIGDGIGNRASPGILSRAPT